MVGRSLWIGEPMAGDWIKMRTDLADDPAVVTVSSRCQRDGLHIVGALWSLWAWADAQTSDSKAAGITAEWVDGRVRIDGFAAALEAVGWLTITGEGIEIPRFERHNGVSAKSRAQAAKRQTLSRSRHKSVTVSPLLERDQRREEKRREEKNNDDDVARERQSRLPDTEDTDDTEEAPRAKATLGPNPATLSHANGTPPSNGSATSECVGDVLRADGGFDPRWIGRLCQLPGCTVERVRWLLAETERRTDIPERRAFIWAGVRDQWQPEQPVKPKETPEQYGARIAARVEAERARKAAKT